MQNIILAIHLIVALLLIGSVLMQRSEGGGLGITNNNNTSNESGLNNLQRSTWWLGAAFFATSISLFVFTGSTSSSNQGVLDALENISAQDVIESQAPAVGEDQLPIDPNNN